MYKLSLVRIQRSKRSSDLALIVFGTAAIEGKQRGRRFPRLCKSVDRIRHGSCSLVRTAPKIRRQLSPVTGLLDLSDPRRYEGFAAARQTFTCFARIQYNDRGDLRCYLIDEVFFP